MAAKPTSTPEWTESNPNFGLVTIEPTSGKKITGWTPGEKPAPEYMNWLFYNITQWIKYFDGVALEAYTAVVGAGPGTTHLTLDLALADVNVPSGSRILVRDSATINAVIQVTKNDIEIKFMPGVTYTKGTVSNAIKVSATGFKMYGGRFSSYSAVGVDKAIIVDAPSNYAMIRDTRFAACDTEIDDANGNSSISGTITE